MDGNDASISAAVSLISYVVQNICQSYHGRPCLQEGVSVYAVAVGPRPGRCPLSTPAGQAGPRAVPLVTAIQRCGHGARPTAYGVFAS